MDYFNKALQVVLRHEGLYSDDINDPGGETYKGISRKHFPKWSGWIIIDEYKQFGNFPKCMDADKNLQLEVAYFYRTEFWNKINGDKIFDFNVAVPIFDFAVNAGVKTAIILAQSVLGVKQDGIIGPVTLTKLNEFDPGYFQSLYTVAKIERYISLVKGNGKLKTFFYGWVRRVLNDY